MYILLALLKINLVLSACYLLYRLFLHRLTFFNLNRAFLAGSILVSALSPFLSFTVNKPSTLPLAATSQLFVPVKITNIQQVQTAGVDWIYMAQFTYWAGVLLMGGVLLLRLASLLLLYTKSGNLVYKGYRIRTMKRENSPFSFFRSIFLNPQHYSEAELTVIVAHEKVHIRQWHSVDILLGALSRIFCWFNPLVWLLDKELHRNLEFIADNQVLQKGTERRHYQLSLLSAVTRKTTVYPTTYFNFSHLKIRIHMMNKQRSARFQLTKYAVALVSISALLLSVSLSFAQQKATPKTAPATVNRSEPSPVPPATPAGKAPAAKRNSPPANPRNAATTDSPAGSEALIINDDMTPREAITAKIKEKAKAGAIDTLRVSPSIPTASKAPLIIVDGKVWEKSLIDIKPSQVATMTVLKDASGIAQYVDAAKNGVILIATKK